MSATICASAPVARLGGKKLQAPRSTRGARLARPSRSANRLQVQAFKVTLKTPSGEESLEVDGEDACPSLHNLIHLWPGPVV